MLLRFAGIHATHGLGKALLKAFSGTLEAPYPDASLPMRAPLAARQNRGCAACGPSGSIGSLQKNGLISRRFPPAS